jgi:hypothetical protein
VFRHFSYPPHNDQYGVPRTKTLGAYFYAGRANGDWSFHNRGDTHRWSNSNDKDGDTVSGLQVQPVVTVF